LVIVGAEANAPSIGSLVAFGIGGALVLVALDRALTRVALHERGLRILRLGRRERIGGGGDLAALAIDVERRYEVGLHGSTRYVVSGRTRDGLRFSTVIRVSPADSVAADALAAICDDYAAHIVVGTDGPIAFDASTQMTAVGIVARATGAVVSFAQIERISIEAGSLEADGLMSLSHRGAQQAVMDRSGTAKRYMQIRGRNEAGEQHLRLHCGDLGFHPAYALLRRRLAAINPEHPALEEAPPHALST
jgi:hypothetical protein